MSSPRTTIASRTAYDALAVELGEESEEEVLTDSVEASRYPRITSPFVRHSYLPRQSDLPSKPSRSAIKKAQKLAREERRQREKTAAKQAKRDQSTPPAQESPPQSELDTPLPKPNIISEAPLMADESLPTKQNDEEHDSPPIPFSRVSVKLGNLSSEKLPERRDAEVKPVEPAKPRHTEVSGPAHIAKEAERSKKLQSFLTRTLWTFIMIGGFISMFSTHFRHITLYDCFCSAVTLGTHISDPPSYVVPNIGLP